MPDIREILNALSVDDRAVWSEHRTTMRRAFFTAHNATVGIANWTDKDDAFADLIDIQLALLFDRAGRFETTKDIVGNGNKIAEAVIADSEASKASKMLKEWPSK